MFSGWDVEYDPMAPPTFSVHDTGIPSTTPTSDLLSCDWPGTESDPPTTGWQDSDIQTSDYPPPAPPPTPPPSTEGGGTPPLSWSEFGYGVEGAPAQWKALLPSQMNERTEWFATMNMMLPFLDPDQQMQMGSLLASEDPEHFGHFLILLQ